ncbi:MAG: hypothetical protein ABI613_09460 [Gemmatimonadota bacterium]
MASQPVTQERRADLRVAFLPHARPRLLLADGQHDVLDAAPKGIRLRHTDLVRPVTGDLIAGDVHDARTGEVHPVIGHITWVGSTAIGVNLDERPLPVGFVMRELAWLRDQSEEAAAT